MPSRPLKLLSTVVYLATCWIVANPSTASAQSTIDFAKDVLPILSTNCFACHGPDEHDRQADLRLDLEDSAKAKYVDGHPILSGEPENSTLLARVTSVDPDAVMPPPSTHKKLTPAQVSILRKWIAEGANWKRHWSFEPIRRPAGTLDDQVLQSLKQLNLPLQNQADPHTLIRRLSLDLIGLPPTPELADQFAADPSDAAYESLVDSLLQNPKFGEHWARMWLDLARYADTKGYEKDLGRTMWPYRDWVINAFNQDMPLDQFTLEQLAGDLLPNPTQNQMIATAFHRNTMSNDEGGTDDEEFRTAAVKDRIDNTIQVWMGLTMGCAKCHTHKYDPIPMQEYYQFYAIFNQTEDADRYDDSPRMDILAPEQQLAIAEARKLLTTRNAELQQAIEDAAFTPTSPQGLWQKLKTQKMYSQQGTTLTLLDDGSIRSTQKAPDRDLYSIDATLPSGKYTALRLESLLASFDDGQLGVGRNPSDPNFVLSEIEIVLLTDPAQPQKIKLTDPIADFSQQGWPVTASIDGDPKTGWAISPQQRKNHLAIFRFEKPIELASETPIRITLNQQYGNQLILSRFRLGITSHESQQLNTQLDSAQIQLAQKQINEAQKQLDQLQDQIARLPIMRELPDPKRRQTKIHQRGNFLAPGESVTPSLLTAFHQQPQTEKIDRIAVARWLVSPENPLTPRVWANRIWARLFGLGIVETEEDFGALGAQPQNQPLLDWLATEYRDNGWSTKKLLKAIVTSRTYRQSSSALETTRQTDPRNTFLSRGARYRLSAEVVRDQALRVSGLLSDKMGGPPVMPPQPPGLWRSTYNGKTWIDAEGEDRFRRGIYTYLKRTTPYPSFTNFDAGSGEVCLVRRIRTNTPLQALITLNDPVYLEAAAALANRILESETNLTKRLQNGLRIALIRPATERDTQPLHKLFNDALVIYTADPKQAEDLIQSARGQCPPEISKPEYAAWILTASTILNLDEFLTRN
jgi:mono/diheme cytochrome c family protein